MTPGPTRPGRCRAPSAPSRPVPAGPGSSEVRAMTRALVVHHDIDLADQEVESLRRLGYQVEQCSGPTANSCPILAGGTCKLAAESDVLVYDAWASGDIDGSEDLILGLRRAH